MRTSVLVWALATGIPYCNKGQLYQMEGRHQLQTWNIPQAVPFELCANPVVYTISNTQHPHVNSLVVIIQRTNRRAMMLAEVSRF